MSATETKQCSANTKPVTSGKQSTAKRPYGKNPGRTTSCGLTLPRKTEVTAARLIKHLSCKFVKGLRLVVMRKNKKKRPPPLKSSSTGRSQPSVISVANDTCRSEAIEDCIQFINSSTSFTRSSSASGQSIREDYVSDLEKLGKYELCLCTKNNHLYIFNLHKYYSCAFGLN
ncbi:hypothetical protein YC2023_050354 [Brassica napus]